jgi:hypothetical protein
VHSKHPAIGKTLDASSLNLALQVTLQDPEGPLATLMDAARCIAVSQASPCGLDGIQQQQQQGLSCLDESLAAAEGVDPWAVAMQLLYRLITALWEVLMSSSGGGGISSIDRRPDAALPAAAPDAAASSAGLLVSAEAAADAWQAVVTDLLSGCSECDIPLRLLDDFARRQGSWEAELRALAVAAALQQQQQCQTNLKTVPATRFGSVAAGGPPSSLFQRLLLEACRRQQLPPVSFLVVLVQSKQVPLGPSDTAVVLQQAVQQLLSSFAAPAGPDDNEASTGAAVWTGGGFKNDVTGSDDINQSSSLSCTPGLDAWGFGALFSDLDLFDEGNGKNGSSSVLGASTSPFPPAGGPRYISTTSYITMADESEAKIPPSRVAVTTNGRSGTGTGNIEGPPTEAMTAAVMMQVKALVEGTLQRGHAMEALDFVMHIILLVRPLEQQLQQQSGLGNGGSAAAATSSSTTAATRTVRAANLAMHDSQVHQLLALAADSCIGALTNAAVAFPDASSASSSSCSSTGAVGAGMYLSSKEMMPDVLLDLVAALVADCHVHKCCEVAVAVCSALRQQHIVPKAADAESGSSASSEPGPAAGHGAVTADIAGNVLTAAAAAVGEVEGSVSAVKPLASQLLSDASDALFAGLAVEQRLVLLAEVARYLPQRLGLQLVAASAGKLHSVMPQAVAIVRSVSIGCA